MTNTPMSEREKELVESVRVVEFYHGNANKFWERVRNALRPYETLATSKAPTE